MYTTTVSIAGLFLFIALAYGETCRILHCIIWSKNLISYLPFQLPQSTEFKTRGIRANTGLRFMEALMALEMVHLLSHLVRLG
jgi:hypothetical protein